MIAPAAATPYIPQPTGPASNNASPRFNTPVTHVDNPRNTDFLGGNANIEKRQHTQIDGQVDRHQRH